LRCLRVGSGNESSRTTGGVCAGASPGRRRAFASEHATRGSGRRRWRAAWRVPLGTPIVDGCDGSTVAMGAGERAKRWRGRRAAGRLRYRWRFYGSFRRGARVTHARHGVAGRREGSRVLSAPAGGGGATPAVLSREAPQGRGVVLRVRPFPVGDESSRTTGGDCARGGVAWMATGVRERTRHRGERAEALAGCVACSLG